MLNITYFHIIPKKKKKRNQENKTYHELLITPFINFLSEKKEYIITIDNHKES